MARVAAIFDFPLETGVPSQKRAILVSIPPSNYVEKARWALQLAKIPFEEHKYAPVLHRFATKPKGGKSVPLLYYPLTKQSLTDSSDILDHCAERIPSLYPTKDAKELEHFYDESLGPHARRTGDLALTCTEAHRNLICGVFFSIAAYFVIFSNNSMGRSVILGALAGWIYLLGWLMYPLLRFVLSKLMQINELAAEASMTTIEEIAKEAQERLGDGPIGSRFLTGDTFSAADITFCAHMALLMVPPEQVYLHDVNLDKFNHPMRDRIQSLQASKIGQYVYWCYHTHRPVMRTKPV